MDLASWMEWKGVTTIAMAARLGVNQGTVSKIMRGLIWIGPETAAAIERETAGEVTATDILKTYQTVQQEQQDA